MNEDEMGLIIDGFIADLENILNKSAGGYDMSQRIYSLKEKYKAQRKALDSIKLRKYAAEHGTELPEDERLER